MHFNIRFAIITILAACFSLQARAYDFLQDSEGYFLITSKDDYIALMQDNSLWTTDCHYRQTADIDFGDDYITPIGSISNPFQGHYDGQGHKISNAKISWTSAGGADNYAFGLFGYVYNGSVSTEICNLALENITITRTAQAGIATNQDIKLGILVGMLGRHFKIYNISVSNCLITDGGFATKPKSMMAGGLVGDMLINAGGSSAINSTTSLINNVAVKTNIVLNNTTKNETGNPQMFAGGIIGRVRYPSSANLIPTNTVYSGQIEFPNGSVAPIIANMRTTGGNNNADLVLSYAGQIVISNQPKIASEDPTLWKSCYFFDYHVLNSNSGTVEEVNASYPSADGCMYGTRTFLPNKNGDAAVTPNILNTTATQDQWAYVQGVNFGTYSTDQSQLLSMLNLNQEMTQIGATEWTWDAASNIPVLTRSRDWKHEAFLVLSKPDASHLQAQLQYLDTDIPYTAPVSGSITWYSRPDTPSAAWAPLSNTQPIAISPATWYKAVWTADDNSVEIASEVVCPIPADPIALVKDNDGAYIIATPEDFLALTRTPSLWAKNKFKQICDIDMGGMTLTPIGNVSNPFTGTYDGQGHYISNAVYDWTYSDANNYSFGVFGFAKGANNNLVKICNLTLRDISITRGKAWGLYLDEDVKIGTLVGMLGQYYEVHDVATVNCLITDSDFSTKTRTMIVGGLIGDVHYDAGTYNQMTNVASKIYNAVVNTDIDLPNMIKTKLDDPQMYTGGIVGRIRNACAPNFVPYNVAYTGTINMPSGTESPSVGNMRTSSDNTKVGLLSAYAGELYDTATKVTSSVSNNPAYREKCFFYGYKAFNTNARTIQEVTAAVPSVAGPYAYGTRTFLPNYGVTPNVPVKYKDWAYVQGVNFGTHIDPVNVTADQERLLDALNDAIPTANKSTYSWSWNPVTSTPALGTSHNWTDDYVLYIDLSEDGTKYITHFRYKQSDYVFDMTIPGTFYWYTSTDLAEGVWIELAGVNGQEIVFDPQLYYQTKWVSEDGTLTYTSSYRAPNVTIYVYNRELAQWYNDNFEGAGVHKFPTDYYTIDGDDSQSGLNPFEPVKTMAAAYDRLKEYGTVASNKIVVMGYYDDNAYLKPIVYQGGQYAKPATITGRDDVVRPEGCEIDNGIFGWINTDVNSAGTRETIRSAYLQGPLCFENVEILCSPRENFSAINSDNFIVCQYFDLTFGQNVVMANFPNAKSQTGLPADINTLPLMTIVAGNMNKNTADPISFPSDIYPDHPNFYAESGRANMSIASGCFGRIILGARNNANNSISHNITGSPSKPNCVNFLINITDNINHSSEGERRDYSKYGTSLLTDANGKYYYVCANYTHDVGIISGGQTDGSVYNDVTMNLYGGFFGRVITGNISYGRRISTYKSENGTLVETGFFPADSFWGRTILNIYDNTTRIKEIENPEGGAPSFEVVTKVKINEIFGGILGRYDGNDIENKPFFYGESIINMKGGFIGRYSGPRSVYNPRTNKNVDMSGLMAVESSLYGAGAGGVSGIGFFENHTPDPKIPYVKTDGTIEYADYLTAVFSEDFACFPSVQMHDTDPVDITNTRSEVNIYSGVVEGNVYGAGFGYSNNLPANIYDKAPGYNDGLCTSGVMYGHSYVLFPYSTDYTPPVVLGDVYGSGAGDNRYYDAWAKDNPHADPATNPFRNVACQYGDTYVLLQAGTIGNKYTATGGNVYGGSKGLAGYDGIADIYGKTELIVDGATILGNIYGGSGMANIYHRTTRGFYEEGSGCTNTTVRSGVIGNCIFGGSLGSVHPYAKAIISGDTYVNIEGGDFIGSPYVNLYQQVEYDASGNPSINLIKNPELYRSFNIYGGGNANCDILGNTNVNVISSLMTYNESFPDPRENPNALEWHGASNFQSAYMDITFRRFCIYGGGYGENTNALNTNLRVDIPRTMREPHGNTLDQFYAHQSFFDIAGGGYSGGVGHWDDDYQNYIGGNCNVIIDNFTFARKVVGGGFYGSCSTTNTHVRCGSLRQVYGGSLLGYVHNKAALQFGNRTEEFLALIPGNDGSKTYILRDLDSLDEGAVEFDGDVNSVPADVWAEAEKLAKSYNQYVFVTENIYGGNDVKGIIGTTRYKDEQGNELIDPTDGGPLFQADINESEEKGIVFNIYGGTFKGNVYCAGNGHYRGYYVPDWLRYEDGPDRMYNIVHSTIPRYDSKGNVTNYARDNEGNILYHEDGVTPHYTGKVYRSRPRVGSVNVNVRGNNSNDSIQIDHNFFVGGRECTIGQWDTYLPVEDPRRLVQGGHLHVNFGGFVNVDGNVYMGAEGDLYRNQHTIPTSVDAATGVESPVVNLSTFDGSTTKALESIGDIAYDHWYLNEKNNRYEPGFPPPGELDGNFGLTGEHMFRGYMKNIEMEGSVEVTFYRYLYERNDDGTYRYRLNEDNIPIIDAKNEKIQLRKHWTPGEVALGTRKPGTDDDAYIYDAENVRFKSFFLGGLCGSMTNNQVMIYCFDDHTEFEEGTIDPNDPNHDLETWGAVYRVALPQGVTIRENVVMGSEDAFTTIYPYSSDFSSLVKTKIVDGEEVDNSYYTFQGGMVTHSATGFDLIVYNDWKDSWGAPERELPAGFYDPASSDSYMVEEYNMPIWDLDSYTLKHGPNAGTVIDRLTYTPAHHFFTYGASDDDKANRTGIFSKRHGLAVTTDADGGKSAFIGPREARRVSGISEANLDPLTSNSQTMVKLSVACNFDPLEDASATSVPFIDRHYGGNIYGGCYNSGLIIGDIVINVSSNLLGNLIDENDIESFVTHSNLKYNFGRVFGGGFGKNTTNDGNTYINLLRTFRGMNVFGGGMQGNVNGYTSIRYMGTEKDSFVFGSIYGGGLQGNVGTENTEISSYIHLFSGNVNNVYGGSCMGNMYGRTFVELCDAVSLDLSHFNYSKFLESPLYDDWSGSRLIAGTVYGGNDIAGMIYPYVDPNPGEPSGSSEAAISDFGKGYTTTVLIHEIQNLDPNTGLPAMDEEVGPGKTSPGSDNGYNAFPLVGDLYGGSNSNYGLLGNNLYRSGTVELASGRGIDFDVIELHGMAIPHVDKAYLKINGGTIINGYGGGNMSTITDETRIEVDYPADAVEAHAGFESQDELTRLWNVLQLTSDQDQEEVTEPFEDGSVRFKYHAYRLFGGNNNADMSIQPTWYLNRAYIGSLYSGGNFGKMTYYENVEGEHKGLTLSLSSPDLEVDYVYGGGRIGEIAPSIPEGVDPGSGFYGATLNIHKGIINHVYGGNDVAGYVHNGTNVNIYGAISGDVYCAGNGSYLYRYDRKGNLFDYSDTESTPLIKEKYVRTETYAAARHFWLPAKAEYGFDIDDPESYDASDSQTILAINSYRPNVERAKLYVSGSSDNPVWIRGNLYCGGNSSTIVPVSRNISADDYDVEFKIGSYVTINGVFMGSNGEGLLGSAIDLFQEMNGVNISAPNDIAIRDEDGNVVNDNNNNPMTRAIPEIDMDAVEKMDLLYPNNLDLYMKAVEVMETPRDFNLSPDLTNALIGEFVVGGNRGSMVTPNTIRLKFPDNLTIYGHIIGGCKNANVSYAGTTHIGGLTMPIDLTNPKNSTNKVEIDVYSAFRPLELIYPDKTEYPPISLVDFMVDRDGNSIMIPNPAYDPDNHSDDIPKLIPNPAVPATERFYHNQQCNIFGGCFLSGRTEGGIDLKVYSDLLRYESNEVDKQAVMNGLRDPRSLRSFTIVGAGYGAQTEVWGDIHVRMLPSVAGSLGREVVTHPSAASIFGGSQEGLVVGNTNVEIRDGHILANVYGASEAAKMYGSTSVIVGYPTYYRVKTKAAGDDDKIGSDDEDNSSVFRVSRTDYMTETANYNITDPNNRIVVPRTIALYEGDIVPQNLYESINGKVKESVTRSPGFNIGQYVSNDKVFAINDDNRHLYFEEVPAVTPATYGLRWDLLEIWIGDQRSNSDPNAPYYGQGNIYGGGYIPNSSKQDLAGEFTVCHYNKEFHPRNVDADYQGGLEVGLLGNSGFGGNSAVIIWDNPENAYADEASDGSAILDHIHIGTGRFVAEDQPMLAKSLGLTLFYNTGTEEAPKYAPLTSGDIQTGVQYFTKSADGGLYGGGRKVFVEGYRSIDLGYYGYAEHTPQNPKLLNTLQRSDIVTVRDCCLELVGASDFAVEKNPNPTPIPEINVGDQNLYAINRVGELMMVSSLDANSDLAQGSLNADDKIGVVEHNQTRSRNYIALYRGVNMLAAMHSNWRLEHKYHLGTGETTEEAASDIRYNNGGKASYLLHKHDIVALNEQLHAYMSIPEANRTDDDKDALIAAYESYRTTHSDETLTASTNIDEIISSITMLFNKRNIATSANMIGINSGYSLRVQGSDKNGAYYGPVFGVFEIKLLSVTEGEGGGYVYALNHHFDPGQDDTEWGLEFQDWCSEFGQDFLMTTGNFVFPGAAYSFVDQDNATNYNYIIDDCYPMNHGFYGYKDDWTHEHTAAPTPGMHRESSSFNVNTYTDEPHYWYINGNKFIHNVTVTGVTSDDPQNFYLTNENDMVNLFGLESGTSITVKEVNWYDIDEEYDITNTEKPYQLYLMVDKDTKNPATESGGGAFVTPITRTDYTLGDTPTLPVGDTNYGMLNGSAIENSPRLGIHLVDNQPNRLADKPAAEGRQYFEDHLKEPHVVQVVLEADKGPGTPTFTYVINLTIQYYLGPLLSGNVKIENCALPGEYIYANSNDVVIDMDSENLAVSSSYWRLYPNDKLGRRLDSEGRALDSEEYVIDELGSRVLDENDLEIHSAYAYITLNEGEMRDIYTVPGNNNLVHIPAYWYQNGWEVTYGVTAGGVPFETTLPWADEDGNQIEGNRLHIHNYHRMRPRRGSENNPFDFDQKLVAGCRVYIEDDIDEVYFFKYLLDHQTAEGTSYSIDGQALNPQYAEGIDFFMMADTQIPTSDSYHTSGQIIFKGNYHGMGHRVNIPEEASYDFINNGNFYNTGFVSYVNNDDTKVFYENHGSLINCYYFNVHRKGSFLGKGMKDVATGHKIENNYQNTLSLEQISALGYKYNEMLHISSEAFQYGQTAYNLNGFYLQRRHNLLNKVGAENNTYAIRAAETELRAHPEENAKYLIEYVESLYNNGDYLYARYDIPEDYTHLNTALRTRSIPNYFDYLDLRGPGDTPAAFPSNHKATHDRDNERWCETHQVYHPLFDADYIFFGEDLSKEPDFTNVRYPVTYEGNRIVLPRAYTPETRVYRIGGFYGSASDKGYYTNRKMWVQAPLLTAVDFVGYRDREMYNTDGSLTDEYKAVFDGPGATNWVIKTGSKGHEVYFPPTLDMPWTLDDKGNPIHNFNGFDVDNNKVTHNLLIYTTDWSEAMSEMSKFHYDKSVTDNLGLGNDRRVYALHSEDGIYAHHIVEKESEGSGPIIYGGYFHLIDNHDFNAPVAFLVRQAWYNRKPADYSDEYVDGEGYAIKTAWEGICLPFNVAMTYAATTNPTEMQHDIGEITHFYQADDADQDNWKGHEYWLRRFTDLQDGKLIFERPSHLNVQDAATDSISDYTYRNTTFHDLYKQFGYDTPNVEGHTHDDLYHSTDSNEPLAHIFRGYRHLSASVPYIVTFPGDRYYEFDLSGQFYADMSNKAYQTVTQVVPQTICYMAHSPEHSAEYITIHVTDENPLESYTHGQYTLSGTFTHITNDQSNEDVLHNYVANLGVLDAFYPASDENRHHGENFVAPDETVEVLPFHVYLSSSAPLKAPMAIASKAKIEQVVYPAEDEADPDEPAPDEEDIVPGIEVWTEGSTLLVRTPETVEANIYNISGQKVRRIRAYQGVNRYSGLTPGFYIIFNTKFKI